MKFCSHCGTQMDDTAAVCPNCGQAQEARPAGTNANYHYNPNYQGSVDSGSIGWGVLGCCIPLAGLILFLVWKDQKPKTAKMAGIGALISVAGGVILYILMAILGVGLGLMGL